MDFDKRYQSYYSMSLDEKIKELSFLEKRRERLNDGIDKIHSLCSVLYGMSDVAEHQVTHDELTMSFLNELKNKGDVSFKRLQKECGLGVVLPKLLMSLQYVDFIEFDYGPGKNGQEIIKVTEKGRRAEYVEI